MTYHYIGTPAFNAIKPGVGIDLAVGVASAQSAAITAQLVRLVSTTACRVLFGANPTALATSMLLAPNVPEYFVFTPGEKIAVIRVTADGTLSITPAL